MLFSIVMMLVKYVLCRSNKITDGKIIVIIIPNFQGVLGFVIIHYNYKRNVPCYCLFLKRIYGFFLNIPTLRFILLFL